MCCMRTRHTAALAVIIFALFSSVSSRVHSEVVVADAVNAWSRSGPVVGNVNCLAAAPSNPSVIYAGIKSTSGGLGSVSTSTTGAYKSTDGGQTWARAGLNARGVEALAVDPTDPNLVYAGTASGGLFKSPDGGANWNGPFRSNTIDFFALAVDPKNPSVLYASVTNDGLIKSTDGGATWSLIDNGVHFFMLNGIAIDPTNTSTVYAAGGPTSFGGVYKSTDGGANWAISSTGIQGSLSITAIALSPSDTSVLYAATGGDVYKSTDGGASWTKKNAGLPGATVTSLAVDPTNTSAVVAGTFGKGAYRSADGGDNWAATGLTDVRVNTLNFAGATPNALYAGTVGGGVLKSGDGGASWSQSSNAPNGDARELLIDPTNPAVIYANNSDTLSKSINHGVAWAPTLLSRQHVSVIPGIPTHRLIVDPTNPATLYLGVDFDGVFKTTDGGLTWNQVYSENTSIEALAIDPKNPKNIYLATSPVNLFKSTDGGATWPRINAPGDVFVLAVDPVNPSVVYAGTNFDVSKSTDGGATWPGSSLRNTSNSNPWVISLLIDPTNTSVLYAATTTSAFKSTDGGASWNPVFTDAAGHFLSFAVDPGSPNTVFAGTGQGVYQSLNGGQTSSALTAGWPTPTQPAMSLAYDPAGKLLYAGTSDGVYIYQAATSPTPTPTPAPSPNPIDSTSFFVTQHYLDFLNREPDTSGLNFWTQNIEKCGSDAACREVQRINTSAAFFLSIEFQGTGYLVYRMNKAAFGDINPPSVPVPVRRAGFLSDTRTIASTPAQVIVGQAGWEQQLEANKVAFAQAFVQRQSFVSAYPQGMDASAYVDALFSHAGVTPSSQDTQAAITAYGSGDTTGRAAALRAVAESQALQQAEKNRAFVLMQYFGYLQRDPDAGPDSDFSGYDFWLSKLEQFNGDFVKAEMVKAFLSSIEYRQRFGQP
jgi:photosystem II stability/assembly factor-like uncharacterized protein